MPRPCTDETPYAIMEPPSQYNVRTQPILTSARGGHHHHASYHREGHRPYHHPYVRPNTNDGHGTSATPFFGDLTHRPYGHEYYGDNKPPYVVPINNFSMIRQGHPVCQLGQPMQQTLSHKEGGAKKPPRPYTEYNIFFQLERERILGELEEEQRKKQGNDTESIRNGVADGVVVKEEGTEMTVDVVTSLNDPDEVDSSCPQYTTPSSPGIVLNRPSDSNDILPRPARFEHLQLAPLWYDSTHRLALSKVNKSRRRHRKTHGLVGFLDLTKRISKAWAEADAATKEYCKRVADRQLQIYKEELKSWKTRADLSSEDVGGEDVEVNNGQPENCTSDRNLQQHVRKQKMLRVQEFASVSEDTQSHHKKSMPPPPPPIGRPPSHPLAMAGLASSAHHSVQQRYIEYWQHQQVLHQRQGPYLHPIHPQHNIARQPSRPYHAPVIPALTPDSESRDGQKVGLNCGDSDGNHTALDELMHRRKLYGSRVVMDENPQKFRSPGTSRQERTSPKGSRMNDAGTKVDEKHSKDNVNPKKSYLSPSELMEKSPSSTMAVTPSPSRRHAASQSGSDVNARLDVSASTKNNLSPNSTSPGSSAMYAISPSCMMTPGASPFTGGQDAFGGSYLNEGFGKDDLSSSPFPYIDWGSPHEKSPQYGIGKGPPNGISPQEPRHGDMYRSIPSHLAVPGVMGVWNTNLHQRSVQYQSPGSSRYAAMMHPPSQYPIVDGNADDLDLDEEEMQLLWRRLATQSNLKRMQERDAASVWMHNHPGHASSFSASPGDNSMSGEGGVSNNFAMVHSFSSPLERPEMRKRSSRQTAGDGSGYFSSSNKTRDLPSLQDAI